jgi:hypothetical protein
MRVLLYVTVAFILVCFLYSCVELQYFAYGISKYQYETCMTGYPSWDTSIPASYFRDPGFKLQPRDCCFEVYRGIPQFLMADYI